MFIRKISCKNHCLAKAMTAVWLAIFISVFLPAFAPAQNVSEAIVKVVSTINNQKYDGVGFTWQPDMRAPVYVVTPLHLVAGSSARSIETPSGDKRADATIHKFLRSADLALLAPSKQLHLPTMQLYSGEMPAAGDMWTIFKTDIKLYNNIELGSEKPLFRLFKRKQSEKQVRRAEVKKHFNPHNYPDIRKQILALKAPVRAGNSGSPITYRGAAISMVDGGLQNLGGIKKAWWSIPLKKNLTLLWNQGETNAGTLKPYTRQNGRILFSKPRDQNKRMFEHNTGESGIALYLTDQLIFEEVYDSMLPEDQEFINEVIDDDTEFDLDELYEEEIDVYEDYNTGATFAIPTILSDDLDIEEGENFSRVEAFSKFSENSKSFVKLIVMISMNGMTGRDAFEDYILHGDALTDWDSDEWPDVEWFVDDDEPDDDIIDDLDNPDEPYYYEIMERVYEQFDVNDKLINDGEVYASMTIEGNNFLGVAIIVNDPSSLQDDDLINYYLMEACVTMAGFPY